MSPTPTSTGMCSTGMLRWQSSSSSVRPVGALRALKCSPKRALPVRLAMWSLIRANRRLLHRTPQHELNIGADIAWCGWPGSTPSLLPRLKPGAGKSSRAGRLLQPQKVLHQGQAALLQLLLALNIPDSWLNRALRLMVGLGLAGSCVGIARPAPGLSAPAAGVSAAG